MDTVVTVVHFITAILIIALILMQQGKGAEMGASLGGGSSQTVFGSTGGGSFFGKLTTILALIFFCTSLGLAVFARNDAAATYRSDLPVLDSLQSEANQVLDQLENEQEAVIQIPDNVESPVLEMPTE